MVTEEGGEEKYAIPEGKKTSRLNHVVSPPNKPIY